MTLPKLNGPSQSGSPHLAAVIDIGATSIRLAIAEIQQDRKIRTLDTLVQPVELGREVFEDRRISPKSIERVAEVLSRYKSVLNEYGFGAEDPVRVVATTAVREAVNRLAFADRLYVATGLKVESIDEQEVNRITYVGVYPHLQTDEALANGKSLVVEVGGGNTELLVVRGEMCFPASRSDSERSDCSRYCDAYLLIRSIADLSWRITSTDTWLKLRRQ